MTLIKSSQDMDFVLASGSAVRKKMLQNAGLDFDVHSADIDERVIQKAMEDDDKSPSEIAVALATEKAKSVAQKFPDAYVIGADQILFFDGKIMNKSENINQAKAKLTALSGKTHQLICGAAIIRDSEVMWQKTDIVDLKMRALTEADIDAYLKITGEDVLSSVGAYKLEEHGAWLFEKIEGDFFTVLGFPLLPFLGFLHNHISNIDEDRYAQSG